MSPIDIGYVATWIEDSRGGSRIERLDSKWPDVRDASRGERLQCYSIKRFDKNRIDDGCLP